MLDDGRLTDGQGRTVDFKNTLIIMTSNIGSPIIQEFYSSGSTAGRPAKDHARIEELVRAELKQHFRPEFLNRVDDIIIFHSLDEKQLAKIVEIQLHRLRDRLARQQLTLEVDAAATRYLAKEGYRPAIRRPPAQARHPAAVARPAGHETARRRIQTRRPHQGHGRERSIKIPTPEMTPPRLGRFARIESAPRVISEIGISPRKDLPR